jgi:hypothetical protein
MNQRDSVSIVVSLRPLLYRLMARKTGSFKTTLMCALRKEAYWISPAADVQIFEAVKSLEDDRFTASNWVEKGVTNCRGPFLAPPEAS